MNPVDLLSCLGSHNIRLWAENEQLRYSAPKGVMTEDLLAEIRKNKDELLNLVKNTERFRRAVSLVPVERTDTLRLSFAQERLWFLYHLFPEIPAYNVPLIMRLRGVMHIPALQKSLQALIDRHETLRTCFPTIDDQPAQVIRDDCPIPLLEHNLKNLPEAERETAVDKLIEEEIQRPFDLTNGPVIRAALLRMADQDHILLITLHHIVTDGWSRGIIQRDLSALYNAQVLQQTPELPALPIQYVDFAHWQRQWLTGEVLEDQLSYWRTHLAEVSTLRLPTDRPRPPVQTHSGASFTFQLSKSLTQDLQALSRQSEVTLAMTLLAAFQALLGRYTGQTDIAVGTPIANRTRPDLENLVGFFVNSLVMLTDLSGDPTFRELLGRVHSVALGAYEHQDLPFEKLVAELQPERDFSRNPLFQVVFAFQNVPRETAAFHGLTIRPMANNITTTRMDLECFVWEINEELEVLLVFNTDLFDRDTIERFGTHFQKVLTEVVRDPDQAISDVQILTDTERKQILVEWNDTGLAYPRPPLIQQYIEQNAAQNPETVAVVDNVDQLTYQELNLQANQLAHYLRKLDVKANTTVGLLLERSIDMIIAILAVLKAGGAYLPLDPTHPQERLAFMLAETRTPVLLTRQKLAGLLSEYPANTVFIDCEWEVISREDRTAPQIAAEPENLAYVIFTSGSTGDPKGVPVSHQNLVHSTSARFHFYEECVDRFLLLSPFTFDSSMVGLFWTLCQGGTLVLSQHRVEQDIRQLAAIIAEYQISHLLTLPSLYALLLEQADATQLVSLRNVIVAGEECRGGLVDRHYTRLPQAALFNEYGPTEGTVWSTAYKIPANFEGDRVPIGRPIPNMQNYIFDCHGHLAPVGVPGELCIGGIGVTSGYLNRPELTAEKFIEHSFTAELSIYLYRTGDLARYLSDGNIEFLGRIDHQVKIRGYRIELGEIEAALVQHPAVGQVVVDVQGSDNQPDSKAKRLVAYVEPVNGQTVSVGEFRRFLLDRLPDYMVPAIFVMLDALPLTPNGKIDRRKLPEPDIDSGLGSGTAFVAPRTEVEEKLASIWSTVLGVKHVGIQDNFFELGGDSILSIQIIAKAAQQKIKLQPNHIFRYPSVAALAGVAEVGASKIETQQAAVTGPVQLTPIQHWFFEQQLAEPHHWNQSYLLELAADADLTLIERSLQQLFLHHDALRMRFRRTDAGWTQENDGPEHPMRIAHFNLSDLPVQERQEALTATATKLQQNLDLASGGLAQAAIFELEPGQSARLLLVLHHLVVDGVSWQILLEDLETAYQQLRQRHAVQLPPKTSSYQKWAGRLAAFAQSAEVKQDLDFWLRNAPHGPSPLLPDFSDDTTENTAGSVATVSVALTPEETEDLIRQVPATYKTQINDALLTALLLAFSEQAGTTGLFFDLEGHGREALFEEVDLSRTVGWFTSVFPLWLTLPGDADVGEALISVKEQLRQVPRKGLGYGVLRYLSHDRAVREELTRRPRAEITYNYMGQFDHKLCGYSLFQTAPESAGTERAPHNGRRYLLDINSLVEHNQLNTKWIYSKNYFRPETIENLAHGFIRYLRAVIEHCTMPKTYGYTPSDFPGANLNQKALDDLLDEFGEEIE